MNFRGKEFFIVMLAVTFIFVSAYAACAKGMGGGGKGGGAKMGSGAMGSGGMGGGAKMGPGSMGTQTHSGAQMGQHMGTGTQQMPPKGPMGHQTTPGN